MVAEMKGLVLLRRPESLQSFVPDVGFWFSSKSVSAAINKLARPVSCRDGSWLVFSIYLPGIVS